MTSNNNRSARPHDDGDPQRRRRQCLLTTVAWGIGTHPGTHHQAWQTPPWLFDAICRALGIHEVDIDPCSPGFGRSSIRARIHHVKDPADPEGGGLGADWVGRTVWMNCPFGNPRPWCAKAAHSVRVGHAGIVIALLPVRTDARWYRESIAGEAHLLLLPKRVRFDVEPGVPGRHVANFSCMQAVWGGDTAQIDGLLAAFPDADFRPAPVWRGEAPYPRAAGTARSRVEICTARHGTRRRPVTGRR